MKKIDNYPKEGICPICNSENIEFGTSEIDEAGLSYDCTCKDCGATYKECYDIVFAGNWNIYDKDNNQYEDMPT